MSVRLPARSARVLAILRDVKRVLVATAVVLVAVVGLMFAQAARVHERYGEWDLTATATPLRISTLGRDYDRSDRSPSKVLPADFEPAGDGGGTILVPPGLGDRDPVVIYVQDDG